MSRKQVTGPLAKGDLVYKGNGKTLYRVWGVSKDGMTVSVVKATTKNDPTRGCWYSVLGFTREAGE